MLWLSSSVETYDPIMGRWLDSNPLTEPRSQHGAVVLGSRLHVMGGVCMQYECHAEVLNPDTRTWQRIALDPASTAPRWPPSGPLFEFRGRIYALYKWDDDNSRYVIQDSYHHRATKRVLAFEPQSGLWRPVESEDMRTILEPLLELGLSNNYDLTPMMENYDTVLDRMELPTSLWLRGMREL